MDWSRGNNKKISRFGPPVGYNDPPGNMRSTPYQRPPQSVFPPNPLTEEQIAFELEFKKWEKSFADWQKAYANHPDRNAYNQYESKFLEVRDRLLIKRAQIYSKSSTEMKLASELGAASAMAESILKKFTDPQPKYPGNNYLQPPDRPGSQSNVYHNRDPPGYRNDSGMNQCQFSGANRDQFGRDRDQFGRDRDQFGRDRDQFGRDRDQFGRDRDQFGRDQRSGRDRDQRSGRDRDQRSSRDRDQRSSRDRDHRGGRDQRGSSNRSHGGTDRMGNRGGSNRGMDQPMKKPTEAQLKKALARKNVYPNIPWIPILTDGKPPLVGKRRKHKNAKIEKVLEMKRKIENTETLESDVVSADKIELLLEQAKDLKCPNRLSGAARKRLVALKNKTPEELTEDEKKFLEFAEYTRTARNEYFKNISNPENQENIPTEEPEVKEDTKMDESEAQVEAKEDENEVEMDSKTDESEAKTDAVEVSSS